MQTLKLSSADSSNSGLLPSTGQDPRGRRVHCKNKRYACNVTADHFDMYGFDYKINERLTGQYHYAELEDIYRQHFVGLLANQPLGNGVLKAGLRLLKSTDSGAARAGSIDNRALSGMLAYAINGHTLSAGWQRMNGDYEKFVDETRLIVSYNFSVL